MQHAWLQAALSRILSVQSSKPVQVSIPKPV